MNRKELKEKYIEVLEEHSKLLSNFRELTKERDYYFKLLDIYIKRNECISTYSYIGPSNEKYSELIHKFRRELNFLDKKLNSKNEELDKLGYEIMHPPKILFVELFTFVDPMTNFINEHGIKKEDIQEITFGDGYGAIHGGGYEEDYEEVEHE